MVTMNRPVNEVVYMEDNRGKRINYTLPPEKLIIYNFQRGDLEPALNNETMMYTMSYFAKEPGIGNVCYNISFSRDQYESAWYSYQIDKLMKNVQLSPFYGRTRYEPKPDVPLHIFNDTDKNSLYDRVKNCSFEWKLDPTEIELFDLRKKVAEFQPDEADWNTLLAGKET